MTDPHPPAVAPLFPPGYRASGILLHVTSLPSPYGIGDLGPSAVKWIDLLHHAGQGWWQSLPLGPTGYGDSPYQSLSSFAGNGLLISPEVAMADGLLTPGNCAGHVFPSDRVDYAAVTKFKHGLLKTAWTNFKSGMGQSWRAEFEQFRDAHSSWLNDYALFRALKAANQDRPYLDWAPELVQRVPGALADARRALAEEIDKVCFAQFIVFMQGRRIRDHARARGVRLIGDLPFYVAPDSSDVWANPELFLLDAQRRPRFAGGVPPDYFSTQGQLWGNPVYDWDAHRRTGFRWFIDRVKALLAFVDVVRLDHFRGFAAAWHVPAGAATAEAGQWVPGPGAELFEALHGALGSLPLIAEDLGVITPDVSALRDRFQVPGTKVLQFAFDGDPKNQFLPANIGHNAVVYTGTHDNDTTRGWYEALTSKQRATVLKSLRKLTIDSSTIASELIAQAWTSTAALAMAPMQDLLGLPTEARMNLPGRPEGNWRWRCTSELLSATAFDWLGDLTRSTARLGQTHDQSNRSMADTAQ